MSFFRNIINFFESVFLSSNPEVKIKLEIRKIEADLKYIQPEIYKNGQATPAMGSVFYTLYKDSELIQEILQETICSEDNHISNKFTDLLIKTGYIGENKGKLNQITYDVSEDRIKKASNQHRAFEEQNNIFESCIKVLHTQDLKKIEEVISQLFKLYDICRFNYINAIHIFDPDFDPNGDNPPSFKPVEAGLMESTLMDLYYLVGNFNFTNTQARAITVLAEQKHGGTVSEDVRNRILSSLKSMSGIFNKILTKGSILSLLKIIKKSPDLTVECGKYKENILSEFADRLKQQFSTDIDRIRSEIQDQKIKANIKELFQGKRLISLDYYDEETNKFFQDTGYPSFIWLTPLEILKTFVFYFYGDHIQTLLNDVVVEGFFTNPNYKSDFASAVYNCGETSNKIKNFESTLGRGEEFDILVLKDYATEGEFNSELGKKLTSSIGLINVRAKDLITKEVNNFRALDKFLETVLSEFHKSRAEEITNIKMLFTSTRNRDNVELLEKQFNQWHFFLEIMKNYVIINDTE